MSDDLRGFIARAQEIGEVKIIEGADWDLEIGAITAWQGESGNSPLLLFDKIKGYPPGYRVVSNLFITPKRIALAQGLPPDAKGMDLVRAWRDQEKSKGEFKPLPPVEVASAPVKENVHTGSDVDLFEFPTPKWHEEDGGRYIGTGHTVIVRDPDEGRVNIGTYRVQIHDKTTATMFIAPGKHADIIRRKYWAKGRGCPMAICCGQEPVLWSTSTRQLPWEVSEYDFAGWLKGKPIEVTRGITTDLPIPATGEIVLEGEMVPPEVETRVEGPFGEWNGYYGSGSRPEPAFKVTSILHRNDPIIMGAPPSMLITPYTLARHIQRAAVTWNELDARVPGVKGVWFVEEAGGATIAIISIKQAYPGHAKQAAMSVGSGLYAAFHLVWIIVVDDDIDPSNISQVLWALGTRCDVAEAVDIVRGCWTSALKPALPPHKREWGDFTHGQALVLACKPFYWIDKFPHAIRTSPDLLDRVKAKWGNLFGPA
ncbi:MAG: UbiD family decarboxylase [Chloroflexi bacterium]|nr:UbiD family decarboxylase [Chloroflexota bacterium]